MLLSAAENSSAGAVLIASVRATMVNALVAPRTTSRLVTVSVRGPAVVLNVNVTTLFTLSFSVIVCVFEGFVAQIN